MWHNPSVWLKTAPLTSGFWWRYSLGLLQQCSLECKQHQKEHKTLPKRLSCLCCFLLSNAQGKKQENVGGFQRCRLVNWVAIPSSRYICFIQRLLQSRIWPKMWLWCHWFECKWTALSCRYLDGIARPAAQIRHLYLQSRFPMSRPWDGILPVHETPERLHAPQNVIRADGATVCSVWAKSQFRVNFKKHLQLNSETLYHVSAHSAILNDAVSTLYCRWWTIPERRRTHRSRRESEPRPWECRSEVGEAPPLMTCEAIITPVT